LYSYNGDVWVIASKPFVLVAGSRVMWDGDRFMLTHTVTNDGYAVSQDGITWDPDNDSLVSIITSGIGSMAVSTTNSGLISAPVDRVIALRSTTPYIILSDDGGLSWYDLPGTTPLTFNASAITKGGTGWAATDANGASSILAHSKDGFNWVKMSHVVVGNNSFIRFLNDTWIVGDNSGDVWTSVDGFTWIFRDLAGARKVDAAWDGSLYYVFQSNNTNSYQTSPDLETWTVQTSLDSLLAVNGTSIRQAHYNGTTFVVLASLGAGTSESYFSHDGSNWLEGSGISHLDASHTGLIFENGVWVATSTNLVSPSATGAVTWSRDGILWVTVTQSVGINAITWTGREFVATTSTFNFNGVLMSPDAKTWRTQADANASGTLKKIAWSGDTPVAKLTNQIMLTTNAVVLLSDDSVYTYKTALTPAAILTPMTSCGWVRDRWVVTGGGSGSTVTYISSIDNGKTWVDGQHLSNPNSSTYVMKDNGSIIVAGSNNKMTWTTDFITWTDCTGDVTGSHRDLHYHDGLWVVCRSGGIDHSVATSTDGKVWTKRTSSFVGLSFGQAVTWGNGVWVATGSGGTTNVIWSADGLTWTAASSITALTSSAPSIAFNGEVFLAIGGGGTSRAVWSTDGDTWTDTNTNLGATGSQVVWTGDRFVIHSSSVSYFVISMDGKTLYDHGPDNETHSFTKMAVRSKVGEITHEEIRYVNPGETLAITSQITGRRATAGITVYGDEA
jgi:hypothetical protein